MKVHFHRWSRAGWDQRQDQFLLNAEKSVSGLEIWLWIRHYAESTSEGRAWSIWSSLRSWLTNCCCDAVPQMFDIWELAEDNVSKRLKKGDSVIQQDENWSASSHNAHPEGDNGSCSSCNLSQLLHGNWVLRPSLFHCYGGFLWCETALAIFHQLGLITFGKSTCSLLFSLLYSLSPMCIVYVLFSLEVFHIWTIDSLLGLQAEKRRPQKKGTDPDQFLCTSEGS